MILEFILKLRTPGWSTLQHRRWSQRIRYSIPQRIGENIWRHGYTKVAAASTKMIGYKWWLCIKIVEVSNFKIMYSVMEIDNAVYFWKTWEPYFTIVPHILIKLTFFRFFEFVVCPIIHWSLQYVALTLIPRWILGFSNWFRDN